MPTIHDQNGKAMTKNPAPALVINGDFWKKAGIEIATGDKAAGLARAQLNDAGAAYVPVNDYSNDLVIIMDSIRQNLDSSNDAMRNACVMLAAIDASGEYAKAMNANGKPYTSTLALAKDLFPYLEKSTVAGFIGAGRNVYLPAIQGKFGKSASKILMGQSPSNAAILKGVLTDNNTREKAIKAVSDATKKGEKLTARAAREIVKQINDETGRPGRTGGSTKQTVTEADRKAQETTSMTEQDISNKIRARLLAAFNPATCTKSPDGDISLNLTAGQASDLKSLFNQVLASNNPDTWKTMVFNLMKTICK